MKKILLIVVMCHSLVFAQTTIPLNDLSEFISKSANWKIVGDVNADISKKNTVTSSPEQEFCFVNTNKVNTEWTMNFLANSNMRHGHFV